MSDLSTDNLIEQALELEEYWLSTPHAELIRQDLDAKDYEALHRHVADAHAAQFDAEYNPKGNVLTVLGKDLMDADELAEMRSSDDY